MRPHLRLVRELGEGGMGSVWIADHLTLGTQVAVKFLHHHLAEGNEEILERFHLEAQAAAQLDCPHVVQIFDFGITADGTPFIVMELMRGESLAERLDRDGWMSVEDCLEITRQTARALQAAHDAGFVHRDVKPDNIFLCEQDEHFFVKLLDFGVAKDTGARAKGHTMPGTMVGTPEYLSREAVLGAARVDHRADLWALAVVAYEMLTGDVPFTGDSLALVSIAILEAQAEPVTDLRRGLPPSADAFFDRAFSPDPDDRHRDARELARHLQEALTEIQAAARVSAAIPERDGEAPAAPVQRRRALPVLLAVGIAGLVVAGVSAWSGSEPPAVRSARAPSAAGPPAPANATTETTVEEVEEAPPEPTSPPRLPPPQATAPPMPPTAPAPAPTIPAAAPAASPPPSPSVRTDYGF